MVTQIFHQWNTSTRHISNTDKVIMTPTHYYLISSEHTSSVKRLFVTASR